MRDIFTDMVEQMVEDVKASDALKIDRERAEEDPNYYAEAILGFHQWPIHIAIQKHLDENDRAVVHAPTSFGKSTQVDIIRPLYELSRNQDAKIIIGSASFERKLKPLFGSLKAIMRLNKKIQLLWPHMKPEERPHRYTTWTKTAIIIERSDKWFDEVVKQQDFDPSDPSIQIGPTGGEFQGTRFSLGILDDALPNLTAISAPERDRVHHWIWQSFVSRRADVSRIWWIGTPHHVDDAYNRAIKENGYVEKRFDGEKYMELWPEKKNYIERSRPTVLGGLPHVHYMRTVRCKPVSSAFQLFDEDSMRSCFADIPYGLNAQPDDAKNWRVLTGIDLAGTKKTRKSASTCNFTWGLTPQNKLRIIEIYTKAGMSTVEKVKRLLLIYRTFPRSEFIVEDNGGFDYFADLVKNSSFMQQREIGGTPEEGFAIAHRLKTWTTGKEKQDEVTGIQGMDAGFRTQRFEYADVPDVREWHGYLMDYAADPRAHTKDPVMAGWFPWAWLLDHASIDINPEDMMGIPAGPEGEHAELDEMLRPGDQSELLAGMAL